MLVPTANALKRLKTDGLRDTAWLAGARLRAFIKSLLEDRRRGVSTTRDVKDRELGIKDLRNHWYVATDYETFDLAIRRVGIRPCEDVFVDFGSGKGRIVMLAAEHPFRRVVGLEFSPQLHEVAQENVRTARCQNVELILADATLWKVPHDATVLFFFNPFDGEVLARVCANIEQSLAEAPRKITIIYVRPEKYFEKEIDWPRWLTRTLELPCLEGKVAIYESRPPGDALAGEAAMVGQLGRAAPGL